MNMKKNKDDNTNNKIDEELKEFIISDTKKKKEILILSGGGIKGIATIGAIMALDEVNFLSDIHTYVGTSVGSLICTLCNIGYNGYEMYSIIKLLNFSKLKSLKIFNLLNIWGLDDGHKIIKTIEELFENKNINKDITFKELYEKTKKKLIITTVCINDRKIVYLSHENTPNLKVIVGIRMSIAVPFFLAPVIYENKKYVDGGVMCNYPISLFNNELDKTIGINLEHYINDNNVENLENYMFAIIDCISNTINKNDDINKCTINIPLNINLLNFDINKKEKKKIFLCGYHKAKKFIINNI